MGISPKTPPSKASLAVPSVTNPGIEKRSEAAMATESNAAERAAAAIMRKSVFKASMQVWIKSRITTASAMAVSKSR
eukprot:XP_001705757.1 Hypothetical protein GL50803_86575 [Giardia lamblia ATCC 50803]